MTCLVTGGAGFIGSNLTQTLLNEGREVVCLDINPYGNWCDGSYNYVGSVNNTELLTDLISRYDVDTIFHMAAKTSLQESIENPVDTMHNNVTGTANVLDVSKRLGVNKIVFSSTCAMYDSEHKSKQDEQTSIDCKNPYALSKYFGENLCKSYRNDISISILRYFNVYGKGHRVDGAYPPVMAIFMDRYKKNIPLEIVGNGDQRRDFINVVDVVRANIFAAEDKIGYDTYNIGSGTNYSVKELADMISKNQIHIDERQGEVKSTLACIDKIKFDLNWSPTISVDDWIKTELEII